MFSITRHKVAWLAITVLLGLELRFDRLHVVSPLFKGGFASDSDLLVQSAMQDPHRGLFDPLMLPTGVNYESQFGLQGIVMAALSPGDRLYGVMRLTTAFLAAAVLATAVIAAWRAWGGRAASVLLVLFTAATWLNFFGPSTYWQLWTLLLPSLVPLLAWPHLGSGRRKWVRGGLLIGALIFVRCLCGYEFISTLILGSVAAVAYHEFRGRVDRRLVLGAGFVSVVGVAGFFLAITVHVTQLMVMYGDASVIVARMKERTFAPSDFYPLIDWAQSMHDPVRGWLVENHSVLGLWLFQMIGYLSAPAINLPGIPKAGLGITQYGIPMWMFVLAFVALAWQAKRGRQADAVVQRKLAVAAGIGLIGALSWMVLAYGHMINHAQIDAIVFYLPFLPFVFAMIAVRVQTIFGRTRSEKVSEKRAPGEEVSAATPDISLIDIGPSTGEPDLVEAGASVR